MLQLHSSRRIRVGNTPDVLESLQDPDVLAAIWTGAWSEESLVFADRLSRDPSYVSVGYTDTSLAYVRKDSGLKNCAAFNADLKRITRIFRVLSTKLLGPGHQLCNLSRIEPALLNQRGKRSNNWHVDGGSLTLLSVPAGLTTEYIDRIPARHADDYSIAQKRDMAIRGAKIVPDNSVIVFRGTKQAYPAFQKLIHRRPGYGRTPTPGQGRVTIHQSRRAAQFRI